MICIDERACQFTRVNGVHANDIRHKIVVMSFYGNNIDTCSFKQKLGSCIVIGVSVKGDFLLIKYLTFIGVAPTVETKLVESPTAFAI